ncbi:hypothetical protein Glove_230g43 [Diversispora epigaea]|uniref:Uncharacterized protein n=1 Tax=Diversispora epigaea TaxID=1348612 RepID=A0A397ICM1_9GLOM|nr:hypothetical protein Glove_230g43 [Diversispora epigaea]
MTFRIDNNCSDEDDNFNKESVFQKLNSKNKPLKELNPERHYANQEILPDKIFVKEISSRVTHRPTFEELNNELSKYYFDYDDYLKEGKNKDSEIVIQIKKVEDFSANKESTNATTTTTTTPLNYQTHPQAIYTNRLLNYSKLPKPKNEENFGRELEELTESMSLLSL